MNGSALVGVSVVHVHSLCLYIRGPYIHLLLVHITFLMYVIIAEISARTS